MGYRDILAVVGFLCIVAGISFVYWPAGLIAFGSGLLYAYYLMESADAIAPRDRGEPQ